MRGFDKVREAVHVMRSAPQRCIEGWRRRGSLMPSVSDLDKMGSRFSCKNDFSSTSGSDEDAHMSQAHRMIILIWRLGMRNCGPCAPNAPQKKGAKTLRRLHPLVPRERTWMVGGRTIALSAVAGATRPSGNPWVIVYGERPRSR